MADDAYSSIRSQLHRAWAETAQPGPAQEVSPFRAGEVTGGGIALKGLAQLIYGRRAAANARLKNSDANRDKHYKALLTEQLERKLATPAAPTYEVDIAGNKVPLTGPQLSAHVARTDARVDRTTEAGARQTRFDTGQANTDRRMGAVQTAIQQRFERSQGFREGQAKTSEGQRVETAHLKLLQEREKELAADEGRIQKDGEVRGRKMADNALAILLDPRMTITARARSAQLLGIPYKLGPDRKPLRDGQGRPMYEIGDIHARAKDFAAKYGQRKLAEAQAMHAADYQYLTQERARFRGQAPEVGGADPVLSAVKELLSPFLGAQAEEPEGPQLETMPDDEEIVE